MAHLHTRPLTAAFCALALLWPFGDSALAGSYKLTAGKQYAVCQAYLENLHLQPGFPDENGWHIDPSLRLFRKPEWKTLDPTANFETVMQVLVRAWTSVRKRSDAEVQAWRSTVEGPYKAIIEAGNLELQEAMWDIDNNSKRNAVIRVVTHNSDGRAHATIDIASSSDDLFEAFGNVAAGSTLISDLVSYDGRRFVVGRVGDATHLSIHEINRAPIGTAMTFVPICTFLFREP